MVLLPSYLSVKDMAFIPLNRLTHELSAHPLCYIRGGYLYILAAWFWSIKLLLFEGYFQEKAMVFNLSK